MPAPFLSGSQLRSQVARADDTSPSGCLHTPAGSRGNTSVCHVCVSCCCPATPRPLSSPTDTGRWRGSGACHSLGQGHVGRVQQELLPAVGAHQLHRLLVQAHLPETRPSHAHGAWRLPGGRGSRGRTKGWLRREEARRESSTQGKGPEAGDPGMSWGGTVRNVVDAEVSSTRFSSPAPQAQAALREAAARPWGRWGPAETGLTLQLCGRVAEEPCPSVYGHCRACTHRHVVKFVVRNGLFHQVWLLRGP